MLNPLVQREYAVARALVYSELSQVLACSPSHPEQRPGWKHHCARACVSAHS